MTTATQANSEALNSEHRWSWRKTLVAAASTVALTAIGVTLAQESWLQSTFNTMAEDAGRFDIGGRSINMVCSGSGGTTYVLEAGATGFAETWSWVQDSLDDRARVCSYDRAGMGLSDPNPDGFEPRGVAHDLMAALNAAGETGPFVLVGHSLGGILVRDFAARYPAQTHALVLVDPSHEDQLDLFGPEALEQNRSFPSLMNALATASTFGLLHLYSPLLAGAVGLPDEAFARAAFHAQNPVHLRASGDEIANWDAMMDLARHADLPPSLPIMVVSAGVGAEGMGGFSEKILPLHQEIASRSSAGRHEVLTGADHFSILMHEESAGELAQLIANFVAQTVKS